MKISAINLLEELNKPDYQDLMASFTRRSHAKGSMVYTPMAEEDNVFVLAQGRLRIFLSYEDKEFTLTILEPGQVYTTHTRAFVEAMEDCVVLVTDTMSFHKSLAEHPELTGAMINVLGGLLKNSFSIISGLVFKDVNRRLVEHLLAEARDCAKTDPADGPILLSLGLTIEQLAQIVGSTRQTVSMLLNDLVRSGDLEKAGRGAYLIPDLGRLGKHLT